MVYFTLDEEKAFKKLKVLQEMLAEQEFHETPCPLLASQLNEAFVIADKFICAVRELQQGDFNRA